MSFFSDRSLTLKQGRVISSHGRHLMVEGTDGHTMLCHCKGKKNTATVGDTVHYTLSGDHGMIESILPRRSLLYRQDDIRFKLFAANIDSALLFLAVEPEFSEQQLSRCLIALEAAQIQASIVLNKCDLKDKKEKMEEKLAPYRRMGIAVFFLSLHEMTATDPQWLDFYKHLQGKQSLILGPSGSGKSTLINRLLPDVSTRTQSLSHALKSGKHTTTTTTWYWLDHNKQDAIIDSPGFQEFGLHHLSTEKLVQYMPDLYQYAGHCRFYNCQHLDEPNCHIRAQVSVPNGIAPRRYAIYKTLYQELKLAEQKRGSKPTGYLNKPE